MLTFDYNIFYNRKEEMKILHLTLKKKWFDLIASGEKIEEYREVKPYWTKRLVEGKKYKRFDEVHFKNGYGKNSPFMRIEFIRTMFCKSCMSDGQETYIIHLGKILEIRNHKS